MIVLQEVATAQTVSFIAREEYEGAGVAYFTDETTQEVFTYVVSFLMDRYYTYFTRILGDLKQDHEYSFLVTKTGAEEIEIFRGKVFCTNQIDYSINNGAFIERTSTNDFIIYE